MSHADHITALEVELEQAKRAASPVVIEVTERSHERVVIEDRTRGTTRVDHLGGEAQQYYERPPVKVEPPLIDKAVPAEVGKVVSQDETKRTIELVSGTIRVDAK